MAHILVVEDDSATQETIAELLREDGHCVATCGDGEAALAFLRAATASYIVLLDYRLPTLDGVQVISRAALEPTLAGKHLFALVTATDGNDSLPLYEMAALTETPVILKPFDIATLSELVADLAARLDPTPCPSPSSACATDGEGS